MEQSQSAVLNLSQVTNMLDEFEHDADVNDEELEGSATDLDDSVTKELDDIELANTSVSSGNQARRYSERFKVFLREHGLCDQIDKLVPQTLSKFLRYFYHS